MLGGEKVELGEAIAPAATARATRVHGLDALRALAVAAVLAFHAHFAGFRGGFLGVSLFFTISGYLITTIILREVVGGRVDLRRFWIRRARRLLPAAVAVVVLVVAAGALGVFDLHRSANDGVWALGYAANWHAVFAGQSYAALFSAPSPLVHYWSLAIEEQYYLVFPVVCWFCARRRRPRAALTAVLLVALAVSVHAHLANWSTDRMYYGTDVRMGEIALGALLALVVERTAIVERAGRALRDMVALVQFPAFALAIWAVHSTAESSRWLYRGGLLGLAVVWCVLVLGAVLDVGPIRWLTRVPGLVWLGLVSYGVYLVHWPLLLALHPFHQATADATLALVASVVIAGLSSKFFEQPIRFGALGVSMRRALVFSGATAFASVAVVAGLVSTAPFASSGAAAAAQENLAKVLSTPRSTSAAAPRIPRVLVIGDSTGDRLGGALVKWSQANGTLLVANAGLPGCQLATAYAQSMTTPEQWSTQNGTCQHWAQRMTAAREFRPDIVLAVFGPTEAADVQLVNGGPTTNIENADVRTETAAEAASLRAEFPRAQFVWANAPRTFVNNGDIPESDWLINDPGRIAAWNAMVGRLAAAPNSSLLDIVAYVNSAPGGWRNHDWRPDGAHLHGAPLTQLAAQTAARLQALAGRSH